MAETKSWDADRTEESCLLVEYQQGRAFYTFEVGSVGWLVVTAKGILLNFYVTFLEVRQLRNSNKNRTTNGELSALQEPLEWSKPKQNSHGQLPYKTDNASFSFSNINDFPRTNFEAFEGQNSDNFHRPRRPDRNRAHNTIFCYHRGLDHLARGRMDFPE